jgi:excisionase family DNA binding protein
MSQRPTTPDAGKAGDLASIFGEQLFTVKEVARLFGIKEATAREWINRGELVALRLGKEYRITTTALREYKKEKEDQARRDHVARRRAQELVRERDRRQAASPAAHWDISECTWCGENQAITSREDRLRGWARCGGCENPAWGKTPRVGNVGEREAVIKAAELNAIDGVGEADLPIHVVYYCGFCRKPQVLNRRDVTDPGFYPRCEHQHSVGVDEIEDAEARGHYDERVLAALTALELRLRTEEHLHHAGADATGENPWELRTCPRCGNAPVVLARHDQTDLSQSCRYCYQDDHPEVLRDILAREAARAARKTALREALQRIPNPRN